MSGNSRRFVVGRTLENDVRIHTTDRGFLNLPGFEGRAYVAVISSRAEGRHAPHMSLTVQDCSQPTKLSFNVAANRDDPDYALKMANARYKLAVLREALDLVEAELNAAAAATPYEDLPHGP